MNNKESIIRIYENIAVIFNTIFNVLTLPIQLPAGVIFGIITLIFRVDISFIVIVPLNIFIGGLTFVFTTISMLILSPFLAWSIFFEKEK